MSGFSQNSDSGEVSALEHVYFSPIKKDKQKKKLSKIGFPSTFNDSDMNNAGTDSYPVNVTQNVSSLSQSHNNKSTSSFNIPKVLDSTRNKLHLSKNNSSNNIDKIPYKTSRSNSSVSITTTSRSNSFSNNQPTLNHFKNTSYPSPYHPSPKKVSNRFLVTNNDHTFQLNNEANFVKSLPISILPQFSHTHQSSTNQSSIQSSKVTDIPSVMTSPSALEPIAKVNSNSSNLDFSGNSSNTDGSTTSLNRNKKNTSFLFKAAPRSYKHQPSASIGSFVTDDTENESTGGSVKSYKNYDSSEPKLRNILSNGTDKGWSAKTNTASSTMGSYEIENSRLNFVSPSIINEFEMLHESIRFGMKKQLENLDQETQTLIAEIDKCFQHLDQLYYEALERGNDLDTFIENMSMSKTTEIESLNPNVMCDNLNDLEVRIDQVKQNMLSTKENLKAFGSKLTVLKEWKANNEVRSKLFKNMLVVSSTIIILAVSVKKIFF